MAGEFEGSTIAVAAVAAAVVGLVVTLRRSTRTAGPQTGAGRPRSSGRRTASPTSAASGRPSTRRTGTCRRTRRVPALVTQQGVYPVRVRARAGGAGAGARRAAGVPGSVGVVEGDGEIPYKPEAAKIKKENGENWIDRDPELKCYLPGIPRAMYMPYPFQIVQGRQQDPDGVRVHERRAARSTSTRSRGRPICTYMGHSVGRWEGDTLVVDVTEFNGKNWFDRAGNYHSDALHLTERFTPITKDAIHYEVTIEDPNVFTRPWKISMPLYRRLEPNAQLLEYRCIEFVEEFMYGGLRRKPLVKRWEGETMIVDITRKVPEGDKLYDWYRR